jgi:hypothetical protein
VIASPSGSSCGTAEHAPAGVRTGVLRVPVPGYVALTATAPAAGCAGDGPLTGLSGMTDATPGIAVSAGSAAAGIRAAIAFASTYPCMPVAPSSPSCLR